MVLLIIRKSNQFGPMEKRKPMFSMHLIATISCHRCVNPMLSHLLLVLLFLSQSVVFAASPSSSFGISSAVPLIPEALILGDAAWSSGKMTTTAAGKNVTERSPSSNGPLVTPSGSKQSNHQHSAELCDKLNLTPRQKQMCVRGGEGMAETLLEAIRMSAITCQQQFEYERWNCTLHGYSRLLILTKAYRETAALYAFSAAGVAHAVARACAAGRLRKCHCAEADNEVETRQTWRWGGCGDNLAYAKAFAVKFLDAGTNTAAKRPGSSGSKFKNEKKVFRASVVKPKKQTNTNNKEDLQKEMEEVSRALRRWRRSLASYTSPNSRRNNKGYSSTSKTTAAESSTRSDGYSGKVGGKKLKTESLRQRINRHNNAVGMQVVQQLVNRTCKCHGVSGSCSVRTCWHQLAAFSDTAALIKLKYDAAVQVSAEIQENSSHLKTASTSSSSSPGSSTTTSSLSAMNEESNRIIAMAQNRAKKATEVLAKEDYETSWKQESGVNNRNGIGTRVDKKELVFQQKSPDFCSASALGPGTTDRQCLRGENCEILCCGRGYNVHKTTVTMPCRCKLILCCRVECQNCLFEKTIHTCK